MTRACMGGEMRVKAEWSPLLPPDEEVPSEVVFNGDDVGFLEQAEANLKEIETIENVTILGFAETLTRRSDTEEGTVQLLVEQGQPHRGAKVRMTLPRDLYDLAISAHQSGSTVTVRGDLIKRRITLVR